MGVPDFTVVVGVDAKHLQQLSWTLPTWKLHKPDLFKRPWLVFYDCDSLNRAAVRSVVKVPDLNVVPWPPLRTEYNGDGGSKWTNPQRNKMLTGYVFVPAMQVLTPYWLKVDTDAIAMGQNCWIEDDWFEGEPAFIGPRWSFTKPPDQMVFLDQWVEKHRDKLRPWSLHPPLNLRPKPGASRLNHKRTVSWCAFFKTDFTRKCAVGASAVCGPCQMPVPSQDGFLWYMATRGWFGVKAIQVKRLGWKIRSTQRGIKEAVAEAMCLKT